MRRWLAIVLSPVPNRIRLNGGIIAKGNGRRPIMMELDGTMMELRKSEATTTGMEKFFADTSQPSLSFACAGFFIRVWFTQGSPCSLASHRNQRHFVPHLQYQYLFFRLFFGERQLMQWFTINNMP
jgi:hypothetical protein